MPVDSSPVAIRRSISATALSIWLSPTREPETWRSSSVTARGASRPGQSWPAATSLGSRRRPVGDGHVDLIVADEGDRLPAQARAGHFQALGPGSFQPSGTLAAGSGPSAIVAGDFAGNGRLDLAVADSNSNQVSILLNNGNGTFQAPQSYAVGSCPWRSRRPTSATAISIWLSPTPVPTTSRS